jgi:hypothetical protein
LKPAAGDATQMAADLLNMIKSEKNQPSANDDWSASCTWGWIMV